MRARRRLMSRSSESDANSGRRAPVCRVHGANVWWPHASQGGAKGVLQDFRFFVDHNGRQHFNFIQQFWIHPCVSMAFTDTPTKALETLALNVLALACRPLSVSNDAAAYQLVRTFCDECLLGAPREAWVIPRTTVVEWIATQRRSQRSRRGG
jgi:hypothetical protein